MESGQAVAGIVERSAEILHPGVAQDISEDCANELSALTKEGGPMDDMDIALTTLILQLSPEKKAEALHYLQYLANRQEG